MTARRVVGVNGARVLFVLVVHWDGRIVASFKITREKRKTGMSKTKTQKSVHTFLVYQFERREEMEEERIEPVGSKRAPFLF